MSHRVIYEHDSISCRCKRYCMRQKIAAWYCSKMAGLRHATSSGSERPCSQKQRRLIQHIGGNWIQVHCRVCTQNTSFTIIAVASELVHFMGTRLILNHQKKAVDTHNLRHSKVYSCTHGSNESLTYLSITLIIIISFSDNTAQAKQWI